MDILEQKRRVITTAIIAVVLTGIVIAAIVATPLINQLHSQASRSAGNVADAKTQNIQATLDQHQDLARQTASRTELARVMSEYVNGNLAVGVARTFSRPRLEDAASIIDNLAALIRYDASGEELVRVGPLAASLPGRITLPGGLDFREYRLANGETSKPLLHASGAIMHDGERVGTDLLLFDLSPLQGALLTNTWSNICILDDARTRRVELDPITQMPEVFPASECLTASERLTGDKQPRTFKLTDPDGASVLAFMRPLGDYNWEVHMNSQVSEVYAQVTNDIIISIAIIALLSLVAGLVVWRSLQPLMHALVSQTSEIARSTEELRLAHQVFEHTQEAIAICKTDFTIVRANPAFLERAQTKARELSGRNMMEFLDAGNQDRDPVGERLYRQLIAEGAWQGEVWLRNPKGEVFPNLLTVSAVRNNQGQISQYILTFSDISERVKNEKQMARLAHYDQLTGLPNRAALENYLQQAIEQARRSNGHFALMFLDLDKFKPVNDTHGHPVGDELLRVVAKRLKHCMRSGDIVGRTGGDEFVVITGPLNGDDGARHIAEKMIATLNEVFQIQGHTIGIGASVGIALYPDNGMTAEDLMREADSAMYRVKAGGRNNLAYA